MSLPLSEVVNISSSNPSANAKKRDMSVIAVFTDEECDTFLSTDDRYMIVSNADSVANEFGTGSRVYKAAQALFSARPKLKSALIAKWVKKQVNKEAMRARLAGAYLNDSYIKFKAIENGYFSFTFDGELTTITNLDFSKVSSLEDVANVVNAALTATIETPTEPEEEIKTRKARAATTTTKQDVSITFDEAGNRFILAAQEAGAAHSVGYVVDEDLSGTYIGTMLNLIDGKATMYKGTDAKTIKAEDISTAMTNLQNQYQDWYGAYFAPVLTDSELTEAHDWVSSADLKVLGFTETRTSGIEYTDSNVLKKLAKKNSGRLMVQYNNTGDEFAGAELMAVALSTIWTGTNTAKTVKFKEETSVTSDDTIDKNTAEKCKRLGINFYTDYAGVNMLAEGTMLGGTFIDITTGKDAFENALQVQLFNTLKTANAKIPQTDRGQAILIASATVIGEQFRNNGFVATGKWTGSDVGELSYGDSLEGGYYFYSDDFATQDTSDRASRKMMPIMYCLKLAGAGHSVDVIGELNV